VLLPVIWTLFAVSAVGGFLMIAAYWLDVQDRQDLTFRAKLAWSAAVIVFPVAIPAYAFAGGPGWPTVLRVASFVPAAALALFLGFVFGAFEEDGAPPSAGAPATTEVIGSAGASAARVSVRCAGMPPVRRCPAAEGPHRSPGAKLAPPAVRPRPRSWG